MKHKSTKKRAEKTRERTAKATKCVLERKFKRKTSKSLQKFTVTKIKARREKNQTRTLRGRKKFIKRFATTEQAWPEILEEESPFKNKRQKTFKR